MKPNGALPDLDAVDFTRDVVFTWNGTTSGVRVPNGDWIADDREELTPMMRPVQCWPRTFPGERSMLATFSWQKVLGGEAARMLVLVRARWNGWKSHTPPWPLPKIFRLTKGGKLSRVSSGARP